MKRAIFLAALLTGCSGSQNPYVEELQSSTWSHDKNCKDRFIRFGDDLMTLKYKGRTEPLYEIINMTDLENLPDGVKGVGVTLKATEELISIGETDDPHLNAETVLIGLKLTPVGIVSPKIAFNSKGEERPIEDGEALRKLFFLHRCPSET